MNEPEANAKAIFLAALECESADARSRFIDQACGADAALRRRVEDLLQANRDAGDFLGCVDEPEATFDEPSTASAGTVIGPYKLLEQIGEGGMGTVWMAQQQEPVKRVVAVKLIKAGMDSKQVIARFEAERQALALMDHPNIARVLDGGTTKIEPGGVSPGRPYFVMDLVKGVPITKYCDEHRLTPRQRLELFIPVCQAVQHAHHKGIIHRDLKPSNVLVALHDGNPVPKIIDFGVAKAAGQSLTEQTLVTGFGSIIGTLEYMSPEQAELNQLDIDTRSDIYSLGVVLYELLTGSTPLDKKRLKQTPFAEVLRIIREEEPQKPSTRLSNSTDSLPSVSAQRHMEPAKLTKLVRGELDWIVMKALEKDRNRRYETANALAADVQRYLCGEVVQACPPSAWYRLRKFGRRYRAALATAALFALFVLAAASGVGWYLRDRAARVARADDDSDLALQEVDKLREQGRWREARAAIKRAQTILGGTGDKEQCRRAEQLLTDLNMAEMLEGIRLDRSAVRDGHFDLDSSDRAYARSFRDYGIDIEALPVHEAGARVRARTIQAELLLALDDWAYVRRDEGKPNDPGWLRPLAVARAADTNEERNRLREAMEKADRDALKKLAASARITTLSEPTVVLLADALRATGAAEDALALLKRAQPEYPGDFWINHTLARGLFDRGRWAESIRYYAAAAAARPDSPGVFVNLGVALDRGDDLDGALAAFQRAVDLQPDYANAHNNLGDALRQKRRRPEARAHLHRAIELKPDDPAPRYNLGLTLYEEGRLEEAVKAYRAALQRQPSLVRAYYRLGQALLDLNKTEEAEANGREAIRRGSDNPIAYAVVGRALSRRGRPAEAEKAFRDWTKRLPKDPVGHYNLGRQLYEQKRLPEAMTALQTAIDLQPNYAEAHDMLGLVFSAQGDFPAAEAAHRKAIKFDTDKQGSYRTLINLGGALGRQDRQPESVDIFRKAIDRCPDLPDGHYCLGLALGEQGRMPEAIAAFRAAIDRKAGHGEAQGNLGFALQQVGQYREAQEALSRSHDLLPMGHPGRAAIKKLISACARLAALDDRLPAVLARKAEPGDATERADFASVCLAKGLVAASTGLYEEAFRERPELAAGRRYDAARAAALAGCGRGNDPDALTSERRALCREKTLTWLRAELASWEKISATATGRAQARKRLLLLRRSPDFAGLRDPADLARLPDAEQSQWREFWAAVDKSLLSLQPKAVVAKPEKK